MKLYMGMFIYLFCAYCHLINYLSFKNYREILNCWALPQKFRTAQDSKKSGSERCKHLSQVNTSPSLNSHSFIPCQKSLNTVIYCYILLFIVLVNNFDQRQLFTFFWARFFRALNGSRFLGHRQLLPMLLCIGKSAILRYFRIPFFKA